MTQPIWCILVKYKPLSSETAEGVVYAISLPFFFA